MTLFADTSALIKLYFNESGSLKMLQKVRAAELVAVAEITLAETYCTLARLVRQRNIEPSTFTRIGLTFEADWRHFVRVNTSAVAALLPALVSRHALRAGDALQLASALTLDAGAELVFASSDLRLLDAAAAEGLACFNPQL